MKVRAWSIQIPQLENWLASVACCAVVFYEAWAMEEGSLVAVTANHQHLQIRAVIGQKSLRRQWATWRWIRRD